MVGRSVELDRVLLEWQELKRQIAELTTKERELRYQALALGFDFSETALREGTENLDLGNGYKLKAVFRVNYKLNNENDAVDEALTKIEKLGNEGSFIAERLVTWSPKLSISEYKRLEDNSKAKKFIDAVLTTEPATPSLEIVAPKSKK